MGMIGGFRQNISYDSIRYSSGSLVLLEYDTYSQATANIFSYSPIFGSFPSHHTLLWLSDELSVAASLRIHNLDLPGAGDDNI